jgi:hypothetical protein
MILIICPMCGKGHYGMCMPGARGVSWLYRW